MCLCWLLVLVLASASCSCADAWQPSHSLQQQVAAKVSISTQLLTDSTNTWDSKFTLQRQLLGSGFHKSMEYKVQYAAVAAEELLACQQTLLQYLPSSIYADPYQLEDMSRSSMSAAAASQGHNAAGNGTASSSSASKLNNASTAFAFQLLGPVDLELPAPACHPTALLLHFNVTQQQPAAVLSVPLHVKYPEPLSFNYTGWQALSTGHVGVVVPWPVLMVDCRSKGVQLQVLQAPGVLTEQQQQQQQQRSCVNDELAAGASDECQPSEEQHDQILWDVPTGSLDHLQYVSWGTLLITAASSVVLCVKAVRVALNVM